MTLQAQVLDALGEVIDPELDEPITTLGFVSSCVVSAEGDVSVHLRLPTPQCAPNFAYLMTDDARAAISSVPGVGAISVTLDDHYTGTEINAAVARGGAFADAFPGETRGDLTALRLLFRRKALVGRQARVCEELARDARRRGHLRAARARAARVAGRGALPRAAARARPPPRR